MIEFSNGNLSQVFPKIEDFQREFSDKIGTNISKKREELWFIDVDTTVDIEQIENYVSQKKDQFESVVVLGIGGSALGTKAILQSLYGKYYNENPKRTGAKIYILDNIDACSLQELTNILDISKTLFCFISKSGGTIETLAEYVYFKDICQKKTQNWEEHFCFIIGENCSIKDNLSKETQMFFIPQNIEGRFSVFTYVWLVPLAFAGVDIRAIIQGIEDIKKNILERPTEDNIALRLAIHQFYAYTRQDKKITVLFPYGETLSEVGEWYRQLIGESIGKNGIGITPVKSIGVTDQHSQVQLYQDGPKDKFYVFLEVKNDKNDTPIHPSCPEFTFQKLLNIEKFGTEKSLAYEGNPVCTIEVSELNEYSVAQLLYIFQMQTIYLWELFGININNQPGVEKSKALTRAKIQEKFGDIQLLDIAGFRNSKKIVTIGWGNGHSNTLKGIYDLFIDEVEVSSIVSMSDDGRTTGLLMRLFEEHLGIYFPPPWDLRRCLYSVSSSVYKKTFEKYFETVVQEDVLISSLTLREIFLLGGASGEFLDFLEDYNKEFLSFVLPIDASLFGHKIGNILMGSIFYNLDKSYGNMMSFMSKLLQTKARIIPVTKDKAFIEAILENGETIQKQDNISNNDDYHSRITSLSLMDSSKTAKHNEHIDTAILDADFIVICAGDLYTSNISNLIIGGVKNLISETHAKIIFIGNTTNKGGETEWFQAIEFIQEIERYLGRQIDTFITNNKRLSLTEKENIAFKEHISVKWGDYIYLTSDEKISLQKQGIEVIEEDLLDRESLYKHDNEKLAKILKRII